jgi:MFS family permease
MFAIVSLKVKTNMLREIVYRIAHRHHPWRHMKFDELAEIYTSLSVRSFGFSIIGIFVPVYLYKTGVDLPTLFFMFAMFFVFRIPLSFVFAFLIGRIGPKHSIAVSTLLLIVFLCVLLTYETIGWPLLFISFLFTLSNGLFFVATNVDFSKIQHKNHGGKELGWLYIFERVGSTAGPVIGGLLASIFAPQVAIVAAIVLLIASIIPLFLTNEPVKIHQKIVFKGFEQKKYARNYVALCASNVMQNVNGLAWPMLLATVIFVDDTYAKLGVVIGLSTAVSLFGARMFGRFIDSDKGADLLKFGAWSNGFLQLTRVFISTGPGAVIASVANEPINLSYKMPLTKGFYDEADSEDKYRIVYIVWGEVWASVVKAVYCFGVYVAMYFYDDIVALRASFIAVAVMSLFMLLQRYPSLKKV